MFYLALVEDYVRVEPRHFGMPTKDAVRQQLSESYIMKLKKDLGIVLSIVEVLSVNDGTIIPGDGATYYRSHFRAVIWRPELHELVYGTIEEITNFGAFIHIGSSKGMIHISQTMEDYVTLSKTGTLAGQNSKRTLIIGDDCMARIVAISYKMGEPKIGLTMRQPGLGKVEWVDESKKKAAHKERPAHTPKKTVKEKK